MARFRERRGNQLPYKRGHQRIESGTLSERKREKKRFSRERRGRIKLEALWKKT